MNRKIIKLVYIYKGETITQTFEDIGSLAWELDCMGWDTSGDHDEYEFVDIYTEVAE